MLKIKQVILMTVIFILFLPVFVLAGAVDLPRTGQTTCYNTAGTVIPCAGTGQDGDIQEGVPWPTPRFTVGTGVEADCVTDNLTGLMWTRNANLPGTYKTWYQSMDYANNLTLCGYTDWRLPNVNELESLTNAGQSNSATWLITQGFRNVQSGYYWSSTSHAFIPYNAIVVSMMYSGTSSYNKPYNGLNVWSVRGSGQFGVAKLWETGQTACYNSSGNVIACAGTGQDGEIQAGVVWPSPRFTVSGDCVTDNLTGLMWAKNANLPGAYKTWQQALDYANNLTLCGYSDWSLPNRKEMMSLIDLSKSSPALPSGHPFLNVQSGHYWSSTSYASSTDYAWLGNMGGGWDLNYKTSGYYVWPVRSGQVGPPAHSIIGSVTENGTGLGSVTMTLSGAASATTTTASDGTYSFTGLADGSYTVTPGKSGYLFDPSDRSVTVAGSDVTGIDFSASPCTPLSGILLDATTNKRLSGVEVKVDGTYSTTTASDGSYSFSCIPNGKHTVTVAIPSGYAANSRTIDLPLNSTWNIKLTKEQTVNGTDTSSGYSADPVNTATGNYTYQRMDIEIPGIGIPYAFERAYNSRDPQNGPLGFGWSHSYNTALTVNPDATVTIRWGDGKTETWTPDGMGGFTQQYGVFDTLIDNGDGTYTLQKNDLIRYNFDSAGRLASIVDKNGNTISLAYTGSSLTQLTDTAGRTITLTYDGNNRITLITDPIARTIKFAYDANGDLISATDMNGNPTQYNYDVNHQMLTATDPRGNTFVTNVYDDAKRVVVSQKDAKLGVTLYLYDEVDRKTTIIDQLNNPTIHYHDELLRLIHEKDARGYSTYYTYDEAGNRTEVKDKNGKLTKYAYDAKGNVTSKTDALKIVTAITYDTNNNPLTRTEAVGTPLERNTTFEYDANGNLGKTTDPMGKFTTITYDAHGLPLTITDPKGNTTTNTYDPAGNLAEVTNALVKKTTYTYDGVGRRLTTTDALLRTTTYTYDKNNNLLTVTDPIGTITYSYDKNNNKVTVQDKKGKITHYSYDVKDLPETITDPYSKTITYTYDALDRKKTITDKNGNLITYDYDAVGNLVKVIDPNLKETTFTHDGNGNKLTETDPLIHTTTYKYDVLNRITDITDPLNKTTITTYDALGRVSSTTNAKPQTTNFEYDALGRLTKVTDADTGTVQYTYDENGNRLTQTDPNTNTTQYEYDVLNRLIRKTEPYGQHEYGYDDVGNMTSKKDPKGNIIVYKYDALNRLEKITYPDTTFVSYTYDVNDNRIGMTDSLGASTYTYDDLNRMTTYTDPFGKIVGYGYDDNGNRTSMTYPDGKVVNYSYDKLNRLWTVTDWLGKITTYSYDDAGNLFDILNPNNTKVVYAYDTADRLTGLSNTKSDSTVISSYTYTLDAIGNHENTAQNEPLIPIIPSQNVTYTHDAENRMTDAGGVTNTFDTNGNMTARGSDTFTYDYNDRLVESTVGGMLTQYKYDGFGNRLVKIEGGTTTRYVQDINGSLNNVLAETDGAGVITAYYVYGLGLISKVLPNGTAHYYHYDSRGSTIAITDAGENITDSYAYDPFGNIVNRTGATANPFRYVGRYGLIDEGNGLLYVRARYYNPELGKFITKDPLTGKDGDTQSLNRYVYAVNNPVIFIDVNGMSVLDSFFNKFNNFRHSRVGIGIEGALQIGSGIGMCIGGAGMITSAAPQLAVSPATSGVTIATAIVSVSAGTGLIAGGGLTIGAGILNLNNAIADNKESPFDWEENLSEDITNSKEPARIIKYGKGVWQRDPISIVEVMSDWWQEGLGEQTNAAGGFLNYILFMPTPASGANVPYIPETHEIHSNKGVTYKK